MKKSNSQKLHEEVHRNAEAVRAWIQKEKEHGQQSLLDAIEKIEKPKALDKPA